MSHRIALFNDSFPPTIDGVAQTVKNYATVLQKNHCDVTVVTPRVKGVTDDYPFEVYRYFSFPAGKIRDYRAGDPFSPTALAQLRGKRFDLLHVHAPFASSLLARNVDIPHRIPMVVTYHTRFDLEFQSRFKSASFRRLATWFTRKNLQAADEVWAVSAAAGRALRDVGYEGDFRIMENGTDFPFGRASDEAVEALRREWNIPDGKQVILFVGRMMWYKNLRIIIDTLKAFREDGGDFAAFFVGGGLQLDEIRGYIEECGMSDRITCTGPIYDRAKLRVCFSVADLFFFPSTYDTAGIVIKEAAACGCPSLVVANSGAAEGVADGENGFLAEENAASCLQTLERALGAPDRLRAVGEAAGRDLYLSWDDAVARAYARYEEILAHWDGHRICK